MSLISFSNIQDGTSIDAADVNGPLNTLFNDYNGNINGTNLANNTVTPSKMLGVDMYGLTVAYSGSAPAASTGQFYLQAGTSVITLVNGAKSITFPVAFPSGVVSVIVSQGDDTKTTTDAFAVNGATKTTFTVNSGTTSDASIRVNWIAIGF